MGRCLHKLDKRNAAIQAYQEVLDYFPDDVVYAAAALYSIGECHSQNGEEAKQTAAWAKLVKDDAYVTQPRSGWALTFLAQRMAALGKFEEATEYQWRTAVAFLKSNPQAAQQARVAVIGHYAVRTPNPDKLKEFYTAAGGFDGRGDNVADPENDARYWATALSTALQAPTDDKEKVCRYWVAKVGDKFPDDDGMRKLACDMQLTVDKDAAAWLARMQKQFARKPATLEVVRVARRRPQGDDGVLREARPAADGGTLRPGPEDGCHRPASAPRPRRAGGGGVSLGAARRPRPCPEDGHHARVA